MVSWINITTDSVNLSPTSAAYMCQRNWVIIGSVNGLSPVWHQANTWTSAGLLLSIELLETNFSEIWIKIISFSFKNRHLKMLSVKMAAILSRGDELIAYCRLFGANPLPVQMVKCCQLSVKKHTWKRYQNIGHFDHWFDLLSMFFNGIH